MTSAPPLLSQVRLVAHQSAPVLTVRCLFLDGNPEELFAVCSWDKANKASWKSWPVSELQEAA